MWIKGRIASTCVAVSSSVKEPEEEESNEQTSGCSLIDEGEGVFLVNSSVRCQKVAHRAALSSLAILLKKNYSACKLADVRLEGTDDVDGSLLLIVEFECAPWYCLRKQLRDIAPYCASAIESHVDDRPLAVYASRPLLDGMDEKAWRASPSYEISDVFTMSSRSLSRKSRASIDSGAFEKFPTDLVTKKLVTFLNARDLRRFRETCKFFWTAGSQHVPGLIPKLFRHQQTSLALMEQQERSPSNLKDLFFTRLQNPETGLDCFVDCVGGEVLTPQQYKDLPSVIARRGGLLCDAPGLGKTVEVLSLVLRTNGMIARSGSPDINTETPTKTSVSNSFFSSSSVSLLTPSLGQDSAPSLTLLTSASPLETASPTSVQTLHGSKRSTPARQARARQEEELNRAPGLKTTLVVVPKPLMSHWRKQIALHVAHGQLSVMAVDMEELPSLSVLPSLDLLLVTLQRMSLEEKRADSVLRKVCFLRCIVDEGHSLGAQSGATNYASLLRSIRSERFWIMTGTPAKLTNILDGLHSLRNILHFLHAYPGKNTSLTWKEAITRGFRDRDAPVCFQRLVGMLRRVLIRHVKQDIIQDLPELCVEQTMLDLHEDEKVPYNTLVSFVRSNVILTSIGTTGGWDQSLLNPAHRKQCAELINNLRLACCLGSVEQLSLNLTDHNRVETERLFEKEPPEVQVAASQFLVRSTTGQMTTCSSCHRDLPLMLITRCGHFFCVDCIDTNHCRTCATTIDGDDFAAIQPGFSLRRWVRADVGPGAGSSTKGNHILLRIAEERHRYLNEKDAVRPKFIVFSQFRSVLNVIGDQLIRAFGHDAVAEFWGKYRDVELTKFVSGNIEEWHCASCNRMNPDVTARSCHLPVVQVRIAATGEFRRLCHPEQEIVGWNADVLPLPGTPLHLSDGTLDALVTYAGSCRGRRHSTASETRHVDCDILLLSRDGSHGLDISCATHIFLLEYLWDAALEDQIVSRAWRLGNKAKQVKVEQLIMRGTVEEILMDMSQQHAHFPEPQKEKIEEIPDEQGISPSKPPHQQHANDPRVKLLLDRIRLV